MDWVTFATLGVVLGIAALLGLIYTQRSVPAPRKRRVQAGLVVMGLLGILFATQATALDTAINGQPLPEGAEAGDLEIDDFDAPLDDDF
ncbi:MAG: hypothetical protein AAGH15_19110 [Myxococcota bacterium]